jgi:hypothetical protein
MISHCANPDAINPCIIFAAAAILLRREIARGTLAGRSERGLWDDTGAGSDLLLESVSAAVHASR